jgi:beta-carotene 3-hydroxylase
MMAVAPTLLWIAIALCVAMAMEPWAAWVHHKVWHGALWSVHRSHHVEREGWFEANDVFAAAHALPAIVLIVYGCEAGNVWVGAVSFGIGIGMTLFGAAYALVHDGLVHGRLPVGFLLRFRLFRRIKGAHQRHHISGTYPYGLFLGPQELQSAVRRGER